MWARKKNKSNRLIKDEIPIKTLPPEILFDIANYLNSADKLSLSGTDRDFRAYIYKNFGHTIETEFSHFVPRLKKMKKKDCDYVKEYCSGVLCCTVATGMIGSGIGGCGAGCYGAYVLSGPAINVNVPFLLLGAVMGIGGYGAGVIGSGLAFITCSALGMGIKDCYDTCHNNSTNNGYLALDNTQTKKNSKHSFIFFADQKSKHHNVTEKSDSSEEKMVFYK